jgi:hypothetical protein
MAAGQAVSNLEEPRIMPRSILSHGALLVCAALALVLTLAGRPAPAADGKDEKEKPTLSGTWERTDAGSSLALKFRKDELSIFPHGDDEFQIDCSYTVTTKGVVKVKITGLDGPPKTVEKAKDAIPVGKEFTFTWKVDGEKAKLDAVEGKEVDVFKTHLEGEYARKP